MTFDCQACGACCASPFDDPAEPFVAVTRADASRLGAERARRLVVVDPRTAWGAALAVRAEGARSVCAALEGAPGPCARVRCAVYDDRPSACRGVEPGGIFCLESRARLGLAVSPGS